MIRVKNHIVINLNSILILYLILLSGNSFSQNITLSGYITDSATGEKLIGANIYDLKSSSGTVSNNYGFYSISLPKDDSIYLSVSYIGYISVTDTLSGKTNSNNNYALTTGTLLQEVTISANSGSLIEEATEMSTTTISVKQVENLPAIGGEPDVLKVLQLMPGVNSGNEASSGLYVRGGTPDQNLILLDDIPIYYVNHLGGFVSTFNSDAISKIKLIKGGFPAIYGSRLSSVLDVRMKDGNMQEFKGAGMIGMVASKIAIEGPVIKNTASYMISFRRFMYDILMRPISEALTQGLGIGYSFYDFNAKINYKFSDKDRLYFSSYLGNDRLSFRRKDNSFHSNSSVKVNQDWGNQLFALRWNHIYSPKLFSNTIVSYTRYRLNNNMTKNIDDFLYQQTAFSNFISAINDASAKLDFEYYAHPIVNLNFGGSFIYHNFTPGLASYNQSDNSNYHLDTVFGDYNLHSFEYSAYLSNEFNFRNKIFANIGGRLSIYQVQSKNYLSLEPRILLSVPVSSSFIIKSSYATMQQNVHLLTNSGIGIPTDLWMPSTERVSPSRSEQFALGFTGNILDEKFELSIEGFYKNMNNLIAYKEGANTVNATSDWQDKVETDGIGKSYGFEFLFQKKAGNTTGWIGYTLSKTTRQFANINNGKPFPYKYDRTHDLSIVLSHKINENIEVSATWVYGTGNAFTIPTGIYEIVDEPDYWSENETGKFDYNSQAYVYDEINNYRMRAYHRLDIGANFKKKTKWGERTWNVSIYNLYNRQNPYYYYFEQSETEIILKQQSLFPIIPSVSYSFKF
ncbi:MAG: TonB-dependent receptor plug domain-containing protein [Bacteroidales bacterium]|jgi:hypothetical protein|nr:TonB-dependent receptor plug domain-containing protein [Bacteroidales bacterium]